MKDKKSYIIFFILGGLLSYSVIIGTRFIKEIVELYKFNFKMLPNNYFMVIASDINTYKSFLNFKHPINLLGIGIITWYILAFILGRLGIFNIKDKYEQVENYGSHGTSRWKNKNEMIKDFSKDNLGWLIGAFKKNQKFTLKSEAAYHSVNNDKGYNMQMVVIGPPGSNKTTGFVLPNIFSLVNSYKNKNEKNNKNIKKSNDNVTKEMPDLIITDPKPELYPLTAEFLMESGYDVKVLDFIDLTYGDSLNPLNFIYDDKTLMEIAQGYVDSVSGSDDGKTGSDQQFWNDQEAQVLAALIGFVKQKYPLENQTFNEVSNILVSDNIADIDSAKYFFSDNNITGAPLKLWNNFLMLAETERTRANILGGLAEKLKLFSIEGIQNITSRTTLDISKIGAKKDKPMAVFILMPDGDKTFSPIINVFITIMFKQLYKTARKTNSRLEAPVYFILEEMANIGKIPNIIQLLGTMRGRRIYPMMIWQSLSQMKQRYGDKGFEDIMAQCDTHIYLGVNDQFTAKYCSDSLGNTTIKIQGISKKANEGLLQLDEKSESLNYNSRNLLDPSECRRLDNDKLIIIQRGENPSLLYKIQYKYWEYKLCEIRKIEKLDTIDNYGNDFNKIKNVINITSNRDIERAKDPDFDINNRQIKHKEIDIENENSLESASIDENLLKAFSERDNDYDLDI